MRVSLAVTSLFVLSSLAHGKGFHSMPMEKSSQEGSCCTSLSRGGGGSSSEPLRFVFFFECFGDDDAILSLFCSFFYCMSEASSNSQWNIISINFNFQFSVFTLLIFKKVCLRSARRALLMKFHRSPLSRTRFQKSQSFGEDNPDGFFSKFLAKLFLKSIVDAKN